MKRHPEEGGIGDRLARLGPQQRAQLVRRLASRSGNTGAGGQPIIDTHAEDRWEPFPLTALQEAYWLGRSDVFEMGQVASHCYLELEGPRLDSDCVEAALRRVVERHDALRTVVRRDGTQQVLESVGPYAMPRFDWTREGPEAVERELQLIRDELSHQILAPDRWPLFDIRLAALPGHRTRLFISLDALIVDASSLQVFFEEWARFLATPDWAPPPLELAFRDYALHTKRQEKTPSHARAREYWEERLRSLPPPPDLPMPEGGAKPTGRFVRREASIPPEDWQGFKANAAAARLSESSALMAAYADVLAIWGGTRRFTISVPEQNRPPWHPEMSQIMGQCASFVLLEIDNRGEAGFSSRARRHQARLWEDMEHSRFTGVEVLRALARESGRPGGALMPVVYTSLPADAGEDVSVLGETVFAINQSSQVWLDNHVHEHHGALACAWDTAEGALDPRASDEMLEAFHRHVRILAREPKAWDLSLTESAARLLTPAVAHPEGLEGPTRPVPDTRAHDPFVERARQDPERTAIIATDRTLSYGELLALANGWARRLGDLGARPNRPIAIAVEKSWQQIVGVLGILQAGAPYLPVDPSQPTARIRKILERAGVDLVLTQRSLVEELKGLSGAEVLALDGDDLVEASPDLLHAPQGPDDLAYVLFTSGTTGTPKGVMIEHRGLVNAIRETQQTFEIGPSDRVLGLTGLHHDMSAFDIFGVLGAGGTLVLPDPAGRRDPAHWLELMNAEGVTVWNSVPAMMEMLLEVAEQREGALGLDLRLAFLGGDWIPLSLPPRLQALAPNAELVSVGGPSETTLWNIWYRAKDVDPAWSSIPYGQPIANTRYRILTDDLDPCPDGVPGEMCVSGVGLARGYWKDTELTADRFVRHPVTNERMYRTGDRGRIRRDGTVEILGRLDHQIKVHGQRIEPGEIEAALRKAPSVREAVVVAAGRGARRELVAYIIPTAGEEIDGSRLARVLKERLPRHMIPQRLVGIECYPLTRNGKIDRGALELVALGDTREGLLGNESPIVDVPGDSGAASTTRRSGETSSRIRRIVEEVLEVADVTPEANLLDLGANSLDMVRIGNHLEDAFGDRPRIDQLFRLQTVAALAEHFDRRATVAETEAQGANLDPLSGALTEPQDTPDPLALAAAYQLLHGPEEREAFKNRQPGVRRDLDGCTAIPLARPERAATFEADYTTRRSHRRFSSSSIGLDAFGRFLACLAQRSSDGRPKYLYASPGGLYPTQLYLHVKAGRVEGVRGGTYYHHPVQHDLLLLEPDVILDREIHIPFINTPIFDQAAFSLFLVTDLAAIAPAYGDKSLHFAAIEAGIIAHLLETTAPTEGLGLCQIGSVRFDGVRPWLKLEDRHVLIHSLLGGLVPESAGHPGPATEEGAEASIRAALDQVERMCPDDIEAALRAAGGSTPTSGGGS